MTATIEASGLSKRYGRTNALDGLDLIAERGQVTALLGPNGAGKTTFVRMAATLLRADGARCSSPATMPARIQPRSAA
jgi:ABC-type multidrug transport system ATPase subunit